MNEKKDIGALFDRIAGRYDLLNHLLSLNIDKCWRRRAVRCIETVRDAPPPVRILDVAIGTGDLAIEIIRQHKADEVTGIDLSEQMMRAGKQKAAKAGLNDRIRFLKASALDMPFEANCFHSVTCAYGVRNFADPDAGLNEMHRVLRPGGQLMILEFSQPSNRLFAWVYDLYFTHILPVIGRLISGDKTAYSYLNRSVKAFVDEEQMHEHLRKAGFQSVQSIPLTYGITTVYTARKPV